MSKPYTYCRDCDNVVAETRKRHPASWLCLRFPRVEGGGFVHPQQWVETEPYMKCGQINGGYCPLWTPIPNTDGDASDPDEWRTQMDIAKDKRNASTKE